MDVPFPLTQKSLEVPKLFQDSDGAPLVVFIDSGISSDDRKRLLRILRISGAQIQGDANRASILILDAHTSSGRYLIRGQYPGKVCVQPTWVQACITAGKVLLDDEDYGGMKAVDDGLPLDSDDGEEDADGDDVHPVNSMPPANPLPTPRPTPIVSAADQTRRPTAEASLRRAGETCPTTSSSSISSRSTSSVADPPAASSQASQGTPQGTYAPIPMNPPPFSPQSSYSQGTFGAQGAQSNAPSNTPTPVTSQFAMPPPFQLQQQYQAQQFMPQQQSLPPHIQQIIAHVLPQFQQQAIPGLQQAMPQPQQHPPPFQQQQAMHQLSQMPQMPTYNPALLTGLATFQSLAQTHDMNNPVTVETLLSIAHSQNHPVTPMLQAVRSFLPTLSQPLVQPSTSSSHQEQHVLNGPSHTPPPSSSRKRKSAASDALSEEDDNVRGGGRDRPGSKRAFKPNKSVSSGSSSKGKGKQQVSSLSLRRNTAERTKPTHVSKKEKSQAPAVTSPGKHRTRPSVESKLFTSKKGKPLDIFVQIELRDRAEVTTAIKKNGGRITADIPTAAYCVMYTRSTTYRDIRLEADICKRIVVSADFILDSVQEGKLQDPDDYSLTQAPSPQKKKGRKPTSFFTLYNAGGSQSDTLPTPGSGEEEEPRQGDRAAKRRSSLSPEPPSPALLSQGKYLFTPAETDYSWKYIRRVTEKNPWIAQKNMAHRLHDKMPHHPLRSWEHWLRKGKSRFDDIRAEFGPPSAVGAQPEKADGGSEPPPAADVAAEEHANYAEEQTEVEQLVDPRPESPSELIDRPPKAAPAMTPEEAYHNDFETIVNFLLVHDLDQVGDEEALWPVLERQATCMTAISWKDFLESHPDDVLNELSRRGNGGVEDVKVEE